MAGKYKLTNQQKELIIEALTGFAGEKVAIEYLLQLKSIKKETDSIRTAVSEFLLEIRMNLEEMTQS